MSATVLSIYHHLPSAAQTMVASARGLYLRGWRYGPETERLVEEALSREAWTAAEWAVWQNEELVRLLSHARTRVPYYRQFWDERRKHGDRSSWEALENWPILEKNSVRQNPEAFLADGCQPGRMYCEHTSGS